jgi:hypothetical protein
MNYDARDARRLPVPEFLQVLVLPGTHDTEMSEELNQERNPHRRTIFFIHAVFAIVVGHFLFAESAFSS